MLLTRTHFNPWGRGFITVKLREDKKEGRRESKQGGRRGEGRREWEGGRGEREGGRKGGMERIRQGGEGERGSAERQAMQSTRDLSQILTDSQWASQVGLN